MSDLEQPAKKNRTFSSFFVRYDYLIAFFLISITAFLVYSNTFSSHFQFDDTKRILKDNYIRNMSNFWPPKGNRYIGSLSFAINYHYGGLNVFGYHLVNIIIHIINGLLVWWLVSLTFRTPVPEHTIGNPRLKSLAALTSSLIFISHPIQTQAVTYIIQRFALLATLFYLLSLVLFIKWRLSQTYHYSGFHVLFYIFSLFFVVLAMKTKEISFTLPFVIVLYEFMFFNYKSAIQNLKSKIAYLVPYLLTLLIIPIGIIGVDKPIGDLIGRLSEASMEIRIISRWSYLFTQFRVIVTYIRLLFLPVNQNLDYDYPVYHSFLEPMVLFSFLFLISIFAFAIYIFKLARRGGNPYFLPISFGIFWFFITLSVESSIIPIRDVIFEHRLYLPSIGVVIAFASAIAYGFDSVRKNGIHPNDT